MEKKNQNPEINHDKDSEDKFPPDSTTGSGFFEAERQIHDGTNTQNPADSGTDKENQNTGRH